MDENIGSGGLPSWLKSHASELLIVVVGLILAVVFIKRPASSTSTGGTTTSKGDLSGLQTDPTTGAKIIYRNTGDTIINPLALGPVEHPIEPNAYHSPPQPAAKGTSGLSNNFWIYTVKPGDTLNSITALAHWTSAQQSGGGPGFLYNYRNNNAIFSSAGVDVNQPDAQLPVGLQISL